MKTKEKKTIKMKKNQEINKEKKTSRKIKKKQM